MAKGGETGTDMTRRQESELGHHRADTGFYDHVLPVSEVQSLILLFRRGVYAVGAWLATDPRHCLPTITEVLDGWKTSEWVCGCVDAHRCDGCVVMVLLCSSV